MSVDVVTLALIVTPQQEAQGKAPRDQWRDEKARQRGKNRQEQTATQPFLNAYGQLIGQTINLIA